MPFYTQENKIILAIEAIRTSRKKLSQRAAVKMYNVFRRTLNDWIKGVPQREKTRVKQRKLILLEKQVLVQYTFNQDTREFPLRLADLENMANLLLNSRDRQPVDKY